jgi:hypothetical protein
MGETLHLVDMSCKEVALEIVNLKSLMILAKGSSVSIAHEGLTIFILFYP